MSWRSPFDWRFDDEPKKSVITIELKYKVKLIEDVLTAEQGLSVRTQYYIFRIQEMPRFEYDIPEGDKPFQINETTITIPSFYHAQQIPEFRAEGFRKYCKFLATFLLGLCERDLRYHIKEQMLEHDINDYDFDFKFIEDDESMHLDV